MLSKPRVEPGDEDRGCQLYVTLCIPRIVSAVLDSGCSAYTATGSLTRHPSDA